MQPITTHSLKQSWLLLQQLLPFGPCGKDVMQQLAPQGWMHSSLSAAFHPSFEQYYANYQRCHQGLAALQKKKSGQISRAQPIKKLQEAYAASYPKTEVSPEAEMSTLIGWGLWEIFASGYQVVRDDKAYDIGSSRGGAGFIAHFLNVSQEATVFDYMDLYSGMTFAAQYADPSPVYALIFTRLQQLGCDWMPYSLSPNFRKTDFENQSLEELEEERKLALKPSLLTQCYQNIYQQAH